MAVRRPDKQCAVGGGQNGSVACKTLEAFPSVWQMLTDAVYDDGAPRQLSTLSIFTEDGVVKLALNDREERRSLYVSGIDLRGALKALEATLTQGAADWRPWAKQGKRKG